MENLLNATVLNQINTVCVIISCSVKHSEETSTINGQYICISHSSNCYKCVIGFSVVDNHDKITGNITKNLEVFTVILLILGDLIIKHINSNKNY